MARPPSTKLGRTSAGKPIVAASLRACAPLRAAVAAAIEAGALHGDPDTVAHILWAGLHGLVSLDLAGKLRMERSLEELVAPMMQTLFLGNRPPAGPDAPRGQEDTP